MPDSQYKIKASFTGIENVVGGMKRIEQQIRANTTALREQQQVSAQMGRVGAQGQRLAQQGSQQQVQNNRQQTSHLKQQHTALQRSLELNERLYRFGREARYVWREQAESLRAYTEDAMRLARSQAQFRAIGLGGEDNERAFQAARKAANEYNLDLAQTVDLVTDLHTATGHLESALMALPSASKFKFAYTALFGERFSPQQIEQEIQRAFKFLEISGVMQRGQQEIEARFNAMTQMMAATGGRVTPANMLLAAQRGGPAMRSLSLEGMRGLSAPIQELGASRTGTALMSLYQNLVGGRGGGQPSMMEFLRLGLLPKGGVEFTKAGLPKRIKPGAFGAFAAAMQEDPLKAADMLVQAMAKPATGKPVEGADALIDAMRKGTALPSEKLTKIRQELAVLFANRMSQGLMDIFVTQRTQVVKEKGLSEAAKGIQELYADASNTPMGKMEKFQNALANLRMEIGGPLLTALTNMAGAAMPFLKMAAAHPQLALTAIMTFKLAQGISSIAAIGQSAGLARLALQTQSVAVQTERAATQVGRYSGLLRGIPLMLGTTVTLLIAAPVFAYLMKLKEEADQAWQEAKDAAQTGKKADVKLLGALPATPAGVETFLKTQWRGIGYETSALIKENLSTLRQPLGVWPFGDHTKGMKERSEWFGGILKERMPQIEIPALFGEYRRQLNARKDIGPELKQILINASTIAFPKASAEYAEALKNAQGDEYKAIRDLTEASIKAANITREASDKLAESLRSGADAVDDFGRRVRSTRLPGEPEPEPGPVPEGAHARGGLTRRRHVAIIGENPELILPLSQLESVLGGLRGTRGGGGGAPVFHIDARGAQTGVGVEIKRALMEFVRESGLHGLTDDGFRDRALAI